MLAACLMTQGSRIAPVSIGLGKANQLASSKTLAKPNLRLIALWPLSRRGDALKTSSAGRNTSGQAKPRPRVAESIAQQLQGGMMASGGGVGAPPPSDELGLPSDSDDSDEGSDSEDDVPELVENFDEAQK